MSMHKGLLGQSHSGASCDITLGDYIARKQQQVAFEDVAQEKKLTFDEWWDTNRRLIFTFQATNEYTAEVYDLMEMAWKAGTGE